MRGPDVRGRSLARVSIGLWTCLGVSGCLGSPDPAVEFLTLPRASAESGPEAGGGVHVGLGPLSVAPHLERGSLAYRLDPRRVEFADSAQWVAPLESMVAQHVAGRLERQPGVGRTSEFPWNRGGAPDVQVTLHLEEFAVGPGEVVTVAARWRLREPGSGLDLRSGLWERTLPVEGPSSSEQVAALSTGLDSLSDFLAEQVQAASHRDGSDDDRRHVGGAQPPDEPQLNASTVLGRGPSSSPSREPIR